MLPKGELALPPISMKVEGLRTKPAEIVELELTQSGEVEDFLNMFNGKDKSDAKPTHSDRFSKL